MMVFISRSRINLDRDYVKYLFFSVYTLFITSISPRLWRWEKVQENLKLSCFRVSSRSKQIQFKLLSPFMESENISVDTEISIYRSSPVHHLDSNLLAPLSRYVCILSQLRQKALPWPGLMELGGAWYKVGVSDLEISAHHQHQYPQLWPAPSHQCPSNTWVLYEN